MNINQGIYIFIYILRFFQKKRNIFSGDSRAKQNGSAFTMSRDNCQLPIYTNNKVNMVQEMKKKKQSQLFKNFINFCQTPILNSISIKVTFQIRQKKKDSKGIGV